MERLIQSGDKSVTKGDYYKARKLYQKAKTKGYFADYDNRMGRTYYIQGFYQEAINHWKPLFYKVNFHAFGCIYENFAYCLGDASFEVNDYVLAVAAYEKVINHCSQGTDKTSAFYKSGVSCYHLGYDMFNLNKYSEAIRKMEVAESHINSSGLSYIFMDKIFYVLGESHRKTHNYLKALDYFQKIKDNYAYSSYYDDVISTIPLLNYELANSSFQNNNLRKAQYYLNSIGESLVSGKIGADIKLLKGKIFQRNKKYDTSQDFFLDLVDNPHINQQELSRLMRTNRIELDNERGLRLFVKGKKYNNEKLHRLALHYFEEAASLIANRPSEKEVLGELHYLKGIIYYNKEDKKSALKSFELVLSRYRKTKYYASACQQAYSITLENKEYSKAIRYLEEINSISPSSSNIFQLAKLSGKMDRGTVAMNYLNKLYDEYNYNSYRKQVRRNPDDFSCLINSQKFHRWINGIRRVQLEIKGAYCEDNDQWGENDLYVAVSMYNQLMLCTEKVKDNDRPKYNKNIVVFDYKMGGKIGFTLVEDDGAMGNQEKLSTSTSLQMGSHKIYDGRTWIFYSLTATERDLYTAGTKIPEDGSIMALIVTGVLAYGAYKAYEPELENSNLFSCLLNAGISSQVDNPISASIISEAANSVVKKKGMSLSAIGQKAAIGYISAELKANGNSELALALQTGSFLNCLFK